MQSKSKDKNRNENKKNETPFKPDSKNNINEKKEALPNPKISKVQLLTSSQRNTISYNSKESARFRKYIRFKKEDNNKVDNKNDKNNNNIKNKDNINENINKNITINNDNKISKFDKKRKTLPELNEIQFHKFNKIKNNFNNNEKVLNTDSNILNNNINNKNERIKENTKNIRSNYRSKRFNLSISINKERKEKNEIKDNNMTEDSFKKPNILENKIKINDNFRKSYNLTSEHNDNNKLELNDNNNKNEYSKIFSLIKKFKKRTKDINNSKNDKSNNNVTESNDNNNDNNNINSNKKEKEENIIYNTEKKDNYNDMKSTSTTNSRNNRAKNNFNFLIHQVHENSNLSNTFSKMYESYMTLTAKKRKKYEPKKTEIKKYITVDDENSEKTKNSLSNYENNSINSISYLIREYGTDKLRNFHKFKPLNNPFIKEKENKKFIKGNLRNLLEISPKSQTTNSINNDNNNDNINASGTISVTNKIVNNNTFNTTYNIYKINNTISKKEFSSKLKEKILKSSDLNDQIISNPRSNRQKYYKISINNSENNIDENNNKNNNNNFHKKIDSFIDNKTSNQYIGKIINQDKSNINVNININNIENIYLLESKNKTILNKIDNYEICYNECHDWIIYYFDNNIYDLFTNLFKNKRNRNNIINKIKIEILCYFLSYDASFSKTFSQAGILIKTIFHLLHNNFLLLVFYVMNNFGKTNDNDNDTNTEYNNYLINNLNKLIKNELKINLSLQDIHDENCIIDIIEHNFKQINNYYKMIIDNLYNDTLFSPSSSSNAINDMNNNKIYKFPQCLSLDLDKLNNNQKLKIISLFFFDAYKLLNNYNILDLKIFYDLYLNKKINKNENKNIDSIQRYKNKYKNEYYNILCNNYKRNNNSKYYLFPIKSYYQYTLMINLDTLVYYNDLTDIHNINVDKDNKVILRPGLFKFLQEMKQIYELILFSNNSFNYISKIIKHFANNEKYFEYILTNNQIIFEKDGSIKNFDSLGRDLKNIIILDKVQSIYKLNKENIIYVKPFYGDSKNDGNILNNLIDLLKKIKYDMEDIDDIRIPINNYKLEILTKITTYLL